MKLRSQQILDQFVSVLTGLPTTQDRCRLTKYYSLDSSPSLTVLRGKDNVAAYKTPFIDREFNVSVVISVKSQKQTLDDTAATVLLETYQAIMGSINLGLPFVEDIQLVSEGELNPSTESDKPTADIEQLWLVKYRHSATDPSN